MSTKTIPIISFNDGLKAWNKSKAKPFYFYFNQTTNLLKHLSTKFGVYGKAVTIKDQKWFLFQLKQKRTMIEVLVHGFGANQQVIIRKGV